MNKFSFTILFMLVTVHVFAVNELPTNYPGRNIIGKGYNIFGEFANNKSIQPYSLFNFSKMGKSQKHGFQMPSKVFLKEINEHIVETIEGSSISEYVANLNQDVGLDFDAFLFEASFKDHFGNETATSEGFFYYTYMDLNTKWQISMDTRNIDTLKQYLDAQFESDLAQMTPANLFAEYGTHFISSAYLGGRVEYSSATQTNDENIITAVKSAVGGKYKFLSGELTNDQSYNQQLKQFNTKTELSVVGGQSEYARNMNSPTQYENWAKSLNSKAGLCGFDRKSLKPIWLLCSSKTRATQLEQYFKNQILTKHPLPVLIEKDEVLDNVNIIQEYCLYLDGFQIIKDCDYPGLLSDGRGEFQYGFSLYINGKKIKTIGTASDRQHTIGDGGYLTVQKCIYFDYNFGEIEKIEVKYWLKELGSIEDQILDNSVVTFTKPTQGNNYSYSLHHSADCSAKIFFRFSGVYEESAYTFGNKGWEYYEKGDTENCLKYSKEALAINPGLWYAHYNVALTYLITGNPKAVEKYKVITSYCDEPNTIKAALKDIKNYEKKNGVLAKSEEVKLLLKASC